MCLFTPEIKFSPSNKRSSLSFFFHVHFDILDVGIKIEIAPLISKKKNQKQVPSGPIFEIKRTRQKPGSIPSKMLGTETEGFP